MKFPFEIPFAELQSNLDSYVGVITDSLESDFLVLPKGQGFVEFSTFENGYESLKKATTGFTAFDPRLHSIRMGSPHVSRNWRHRDAGAGEDARSQYPNCSRKPVEGQRRQRAARRRDDC